MRKIALQMMSGGLCLLAAGCFFSRAPFREVKNYDIPVPKVQSWARTAHFGAIRNLSSADRRFLYQYKDGRMRHDDRNRFLLAPEAMLERYLREALNCNAHAGTPEIHVEAVITRFCFDEEKNTALLGVEYSVRRGRESVRRGGSYQASCAQCSRAKAMEKCFQDSLNALHDCIRLLYARESAK